MEIIPADKVTDNQWKSYAGLRDEMDKKNGPDSVNRETSWEILKKDILEDMEYLKQDFLTCYLFLENEEAAGWLGIRLIGNDAEFVFHALYDEIPDKVMKIVLEIVLKYISEKNKSEINFYSKSGGVVKSFAKAGAEILDYKIFAKLNKDDIDMKELQMIEKSISEKIDYKLVTYDTIPEEMMERYLKIYNEARVDMNINNPNKVKIKERTKEELLRKLKWDKGPDDKMFVYMLLDNGKIAAFCSLFIRIENSHMVDQAGGLTTVGRNYRGQGLAKFLKAKMYLKMLKEYPDFEFIRTDTYPWNDHMYRINEKMGFKPYETYTEMKFKNITIKKFLDSHE